MSTGRRNYSRNTKCSSVVEAISLNLFSATSSRSSNASDYFGLGIDSVVRMAFFTERFTIFWFSVESYEVLCGWRWSSRRHRWSDGSGLLCNSLPTKFFDSSLVFPIKFHPFFLPFLVGDECRCTSHCSNLRLVGGDDVWSLISSCF